MSGIVNAVRQLVLDPASQYSDHCSVAILASKDSQVAVARHDEHFLVQLVNQESKCVIAFGHFLLNADCTNLAEVFEQHFFCCVVFFVELGSRLVSILLVVRRDCKSALLRVHTFKDKNAVFRTALVFVNDFQHVV